MFYFKSAAYANNLSPYLSHTKTSRQVDIRRMCNSRDMSAILPDLIIEFVIRNQVQSCEYETVLRTAEMDQVCLARCDEERCAALRTCGVAFNVVERLARCP
jgi:hypothetical protein